LNISNKTHASINIRPIISTEKEIRNSASACEPQIAALTHYRESHKTEFERFGNYSQLTVNWINTAASGLSG